MARGSFRAFSGDLETMADSWAKSAVTTEVWKDEGFFVNTESKPFRVSSGNVVGIGKPGEKKADNVCRTAHEKISSDLAFELKLPIPPVILLDMGELKEANRERYVAISAIPFPQPSSWGQASATFTDQHKNEASQVMSAMLAFETWVSCNDRKDDHVLAYLPAAAHPLQLAFIDYAFSMSYHWTVPDDPAGLTGTYLPVQKDDDALRTMVDRINQFEDDKVRDIVTRIPREYLQEAKQALILANLKSRKEKLHTLFGLK
jgi:hypothetical protein